MKRKEKDIEKKLQRNSLKQKDEQNFLLPWKLEKKRCEKKSCVEKK